MGNYNVWLFDSCIRTLVIERRSFGRNLSDASEWSYLIGPSTIQDFNFCCRLIHAFVILIGHTHKLKQLFSACSFVNVPWNSHLMVWSIQLPIRIDHQIPYRFRLVRKIGFQYSPWHMIITNHINKILIRLNIQSVLGKTFEWGFWIFY